MSKKPFKLNEITYNSFSFHLLREVDFYNFNVRQKNLHDCLGETPHISLPYLWIGTLKFANNVETL